jgi:hypothetical protein
MSAPVSSGDVVRGPEAANTNETSGVPDWLRHHRNERVTEYVSAKYDWSGLMADLLHTPEWPSNRPIHEIHVPVGENNTLPPEPPRWTKLMHAFRHAGWKMPALWATAMRPGEEKRSLNALQFCPRYQAFIEQYKAFVLNEIAPTCGDASGVVFQCPPTIRVAMPSRAATIKKHSDSEYDRHQPGEINFWVPVGKVRVARFPNSDTLFSHTRLTTDTFPLFFSQKVFGNNCLRIESAPNANDFVKVPLTANQYLRFDGYSCAHHTVPNDTGYTRISFDFRVVPQSLYVESHSVNKKNRGKIGDYRAEKTGPTRLREMDAGVKGIRGSKHDELEKSSTIY